MLACSVLLCGLQLDIANWVQNISQIYSFVSSFICFICFYAQVINSSLISFSVKLLGWSVWCGSPYSE